MVRRRYMLRSVALGGGYMLEKGTLVSIVGVRVQVSGHAVLRVQGEEQELTRLLDSRALYEASCTEADANSRMSA